MRIPLVLSLALALPLAARAEDKKPDAPKDLPVTAKLVAKKTTYALDLGGMTADDFRKALKDEKARSYPAAPAVELTLVLTNESKKDVKIWVAGDATSLNLELKGPGAVSITAQKIFTREFRAPKVVELAAGKTHEISIASLQYGFRGVAMRAYWTEPGEYTLAASFTTAINPAPDGVKADTEGFGRVAITAEPVKIKVEAK
jgi:hypothetical protein